MLLRGSPNAGSVSYAQVRKMAGSSLGRDENGCRKEFLKLVEAASRLAPAEGR